MHIARTVEDYYCIDISIARKFFDTAVGFLSIYESLSFEETDSTLKAYISVKDYSKDLEGYLDELAQKMAFTWSKSVLKGQNWNTEWETNFQPILVDDFCSIRADFHPPNQIAQHEIIINPKMAFGTGHHETTFMVIQLMSAYNFNKAKVLDFGSGTGILAILGAMLGATDIDAVEIESPAFENSLENATINQVSNINFIHGILDNVMGNNYDIILANINRHVILNSLATLNNILKSNGTLIVSGILEQDESLILEQTQKHHFQLVLKKQKGNWLALRFKKVEHINIL